MLSQRGHTAGLDTLTSTRCNQDTQEFAEAQLSSQRQVASSSLIQFQDRAHELDCFNATKEFVMGGRNGSSGDSAHIYATPTSNPRQYRAVDKHHMSALYTTPDRVPEILTPESPTHYRIGRTDSAQRAELLNARLSKRLRQVDGYELSPCSTIVVTLNVPVKLSQISVISLFSSFGEIQRFEVISESPRVMLFSYNSRLHASAATKLHGRTYQGQLLAVEHYRSEIQPALLSLSMPELSYSKSTDGVSQDPSSACSSITSAFDQQVAILTRGDDESPFNQQMTTASQYECIHDNPLEASQTHAMPIKQPSAQEYLPLANEWRSAHNEGIGIGAMVDSSADVKIRSIAPLFSAYPSVSTDPPDDPRTRETYNKVNFGAIARGMDIRTTIMIKNIPNKISQGVLKDWIDQTNARTYDFLYLRIDFKNRCNVGYAFINFMNPMDIIKFAQVRVGTSWDAFCSEKVCDISYANTQGKEALVEKFRNSCIMDEQESYRPRIYYSFGHKQGLEEPFPPPNDLQRKARSIQAASQVGLYPPQTSSIQDHNAQGKKMAMGRSSSMTGALVPERKYSRFANIMSRSVSCMGASPIH